MKPKPLSVLKSLEEKYVAVMKKLQFDTFEMVSEDEDGKLGFKVNYHYMSQVKMQTMPTVLPEPAALHRKP